MVYSRGGAEVAGVFVGLEVGEWTQGRCLGVTRVGGVNCYMGNR